MSIAIIAAAHGVAGQSVGLSREVIAQLVERASQAGRTISIRTCRTVGDMADCLRRLDGNGTEFVLLDPGTHASSNREISACLHELKAPSIEVHAELPCTACVPACGKPVSVIGGYGAQGYVLALSIALEYLGCSECENRFHVGT